MPRSLVLICCLFTVFASGQSYLIHNYTVSDGLPSSTIFDVKQDSLGQIWCATRSGLAINNGEAWEWLPTVGNHSSREFKYFIDGRPSEILMAQVNNPISIYRYDGSTRKPKLFKSLLNSLPGHIRRLVTTTTKNSQNFLAVLESHDLFVYNDQRWQRINLPFAEAQTPIYAQLPRADGWLLGTGNGTYLVTLTGGDHQVSLLNFPVSGACRALIADSSLTSNPKYYGLPGLWILDDEGVAVITGDGLQRLAVAYEKNPEIPATIIPDGLGGAYFSDGSTTWFIENDLRTIELLTGRSGLVNEGQTSLYRDRENNIWLGGNRGLSKLISKRFANYNELLGLYQSEVSAILHTSDNSIYLGHSSGYTYIKDGIFHPVAFPRVENMVYRESRVLDMEEAPDGSVWMAASFGGIINVRGKKIIKRLETPGKNPLISTSVRLDNSARLWASCDSQLIQIVDGVGRPAASQPPRKVYIRRLFTGLDSTLYLATQAYGLVSLKNGRWQFLKSSNAAANNVYSFFDSGERVWVGTIDGLYYVADDSLRKHRSHRIYIDRPIYFISPDSRGSLWFGTDNGVYCFDGENARHYTQRHGLLGLETNRAAGSVDPAGRIWIGTESGLSIYYPDLDHIPGKPPLVHIAELEVNGEKVTTDRPIDLYSEENSLTFRLLGMSFVDEKSLTFQVQLNGYDNAPFFTRQPEVRYQNLPEGSYTLEVRASNLYGQWSKPVVSTPLIVHQAFYLRGWFIFLTIAIFGGLLTLTLIVVSMRRYLKHLEQNYQAKTMALKASEEKYRTLFEASEDLIFITSPTGRILDINPAGIRLLGYPSLVAIQQRDITKDFFVKAVQYRRIVRALTKKGNLQKTEVKVKRLDNEVLHFLMTASAIRDETDKIVAYRGIMHDITERRRLEEQLFLSEKMKSIGLLAGGIAHDFNNILSSILGYISLLKEELSVATTTYRYADVIEKSAGRAAELTSQLLAFARGGKYENHPIDLNQLVDETYAIISRTFPKSIEIQHKISGNSLVVEGDAAQLQQMIMNLCVNARDAMPDGGRLCLKTWSSGKSNGRKSSAVLQVSDTGIGIQQEALQRIFEPFYTTKPMQKGTGLGLSMAYGVVRNHAGEINVDSKPGKGTTFTIYLPLSGKEPRQPVSETQQTEKGSGTILVVDDEKLVRNFLSDGLKRAGYNIISVENGEEALKIYQKKQPDIDLIILDMIMPKMDGKAVLQELKSRDLPARVVLATGYSKSIAIDQSDPYIRGVLLKPFKLQTLLSKVKEALK